MLITPRVRRVMTKGIASIEPCPLHSCTGRLHPRRCEAGSVTNLVARSTVVMPLFRACTVRAPARLFPVSPGGSEAAPSSLELAVCCRLEVRLNHAAQNTHRRLTARLLDLLKG